MSDPKCSSKIDLGGEAFGGTFSAATHLIPCNLTTAHTVHRGSSRAHDQEGREVQFDIYWTHPSPAPEAWTGFRGIGE